MLIHQTSANGILVRSTRLSINRHPLLSRNIGVSMPHAKCGFDAGCRELVRSARPTFLLLLITPLKSASARRSGRSSARPLMTLLPPVGLGAAPCDPADGPSPEVPWHGERTSAAALSRLCGRLNRYSVIAPDRTVLPRQAPCPSVTPCDCVLSCDRLVSVSCDRL